MKLQGAELEECRHAIESNPRSHPKYAVRHLVIAFHVFSYFPFSPGILGVAKAEGTSVPPGLAACRVETPGKPMSQA